MWCCQNADHFLPPFYDKHNLSSSLRSSIILFFRNIHTQNTMLTSLLIYCSCFVVFLTQTATLPSRIKRQEDVFNNNQQSLNLSPSSSTTTRRTTASTTTQNPNYVTCTRNCAATPEYNPVCGSNGVTYTNMNRFRCANQCGAGITLVFSGTCAPL